MTDSTPHSTLATVEECRERIAEAQHVLDHKDDYDVEVHVQASRNRSQWERLLAYAERIAGLEEQFERVLYIAENLFQMVPQGVWRKHGAEWQGQYEGDYHAEQLRGELASYRASIPANNLGTSPAEESGRTEADPAIERDCTNCDGLGHNVGWPHTTCPVCEGSGSESAPASSPNDDGEMPYSVGLPS